MISASPEFMAAASADFRHPKLMVDILYTDPFVQSGNIVASPHVNNFGDLDTEIVDDLLLHTADTKTSTPYKYVINDGTWLNDGTFYFVPGTVEEAAYNQVGWYTDLLCDGSGDFAGDHPELIITFASERAIRHIVVVGEPTLSEYPTDFDVYIYDIDSNILNPVTNFTGGSVETALDFVSDNIVAAKSMKLVLNAWSAPNTIGKIVEFFGVVTDTFYDDNIMSLDVLEEAEADNGTSPIGNVSCNEMSIEIQNISIVKDGTEYSDPFIPYNTSSYLHNRITKNVRIVPYIGFMLQDSSIEYVKMGTFWSTEWDVSQTKYSATITARDRLEILRHNDFIADEILTDVSLKDIAEYVLNDAKVKIPLNDLAWEISSDLDAYTVEYAWLGNVTYFEALSKIASACLGRVYSNRDDKIIIESFAADQIESSPDITITGNDFFEQSNPTKELYNYVSVKVSPLVPQDEDTEVYISEDISVGESETTITQSIKWENDAAIDLSVPAPYDLDGITMIKTQEILHPWGATVTFEKTSGTSGTFKFKVLGKKLVLETNPDVIEYDDESISLYNKQKYETNENFLIQNDTTAGSIAIALLTTLLNDRRDIVVEVQGNPCTEIGDTAEIEVYCKGSTFVDARIIRQQFKASKSGLRCSITARKTIDYGESS
ncbi:MAG: hypothetical protein WC998_06120 [Candidatus Paceibacterota bacterium]|jgi:hypothetical protein